jgi:hypothetical protein
MTMRWCGLLQRICGYYQIIDQNNANVKLALYFYGLTAFI